MRGRDEEAAASGYAVRGRDESERREGEKRARDKRERQKGEVARRSKF